MYLNFPVKGLRGLCSPWCCCNTGDICSSVCERCASQLLSQSAVLTWCTVNTCDTDSHGPGQSGPGLQGLGGGLGRGGGRHPQVGLGPQQHGVLGLLRGAGVYHWTARYRTKTVGRKLTEMVVTTTEAWYWKC